MSPSPSRYGNATLPATGDHYRGDWRAIACFGIEKGGRFLYVDKVAPSYRRQDHDLNFVLDLLGLVPNGLDHLRPLFNLGFLVLCQVVRASSAR